MAYNVYQSDSKIRVDTFVRNDYKISIRENLPGISYGNAEQTKRIKDYLKKYSGMPDNDNEEKK